MPCWLKRRKRKRKRAQKKESQNKNSLTKSFLLEMAGEISDSGRIEGEIFFLKRKLFWDHNANFLSLSDVLPTNLEISSLKENCSISTDPNTKLNYG